MKGSGLVALGCFSSFPGNCSTIPLERGVFGLEGSGALSGNLSPCVKIPKPLCLILVRLVRRLVAFGWDFRLVWGFRMVGWGLGA